MTVDSADFDLGAQLEEALSDDVEETPDVPETKNHAKNREIADRARKVVVDDFDQARNVRRPLENIWVECYRLYMNDPGVKFYRGRANLAIPAAYQDVETLHARLMRTFFSSDRWFRTQPREEADKERAEKVEALLRWETDRRGYKDEFEHALKQAAIFGTTYMKVYWDHRTPRIVKKKALPDGTTRREFVEDSAAQGPVAKMVFIEDMYVATNTVPSIDEQPFVIERALISEAELWAMSDAGIYENVGDVEPTNKASSIEDHDSTMRIARANSLGIDVGLDGDQYDSVNRYEILERWGEFDLKGDGKMVQCVLVVANRKHVLRVEENPFDHQQRPYVVGRYTVVPGEFFGMGVIQPVRSLCYELNDTRNQAMDHQTYSLNPMFIVGAGAGVDETTFIAGQGKIWDVANVNQIKPIEIPQNVALVAMQREAQIRSNIQESTGATPLMSGGDPGRVEKATVFTGLIEEGNVRLSRVVERMTMDVLVPSLQMFWTLEQQFREEKVMIRALGQKAGNFSLEMRPEEILGDFDFMPVGAMQMGAAFMRHQGLQNALQIFSPMVQQGLLPPDVILKMGKKLWDDGFGFYDAEDIFPEDAHETFLTPDQENWELLTGNGDIRAHPREDHKEHVNSHAPALQHAEQNSPPQVAALLRQHVQEHMAFANPQGGAGAPAAPQAQGNVFGPPNPGGSAIAGGTGNTQAKAAGEAPYQQVPR